MKKHLFLFSIFMFLTLFLMSCKDGSTETEPTEPSFTAGLVISDYTLTKGETVTIDYQITPAGTFGVVTFEVVTSTPANAISIVGTTLSALEVGTASVKAIVSNMPGASITFSAEKIFSVTINPIPVVDGEFILNGGFEFGLNEWTVTSLFGVDAYGTTVVDNYTHGGEAALNLWYDDDLDELSEAVDLSLSQTIDALSADTYLFQLWYQGTMTSIDLTVYDGETVIATEQFSGFDYNAPEGHQGYVNYGIEFTLATSKTIRVEIQIIGAEEAWGYIDDVSLKTGTLEDLVVVPPSGEEGYINFIDGGQFTSLTPWTIEITGDANNKTATLSSGRLSIWADGPAIFTIYQQVELIEEVYQMAIYLNGGVIGTEFNALYAHIYIRNDDIIYTETLTPEGWNQGVMKRIERSEIPLSGTYEVGIQIAFDGGSNNWINLDDFVLWSYNLPQDPADLIAAEAVDAKITALPAQNDLTIEDEEAILDARESYDALTELQKTYVENLNALILLEEKLELLKAGNPLDFFNADGKFESDDWSLSAINWTATSGNEWVTDWGYESEKSYNPYKDQANELLISSIERELLLAQGAYLFSIDLAGENVTLNVHIGDDIYEIIVTSGSYINYTFDFDVLEGTYLVKLEAVRTSGGWLHMDNAMIEEKEPSALDIFNEEGKFESDDTWLMSSVHWTVQDGNQWTTDWGYESAKSYNPYKDQPGSLLVSSISKPLALEPGDYTFSIYIAGASVEVSVLIGEVTETILVTSGSYSLYTFHFSLTETSEDIIITMTRLTDGWIHIDDVQIVHTVS